MDNNKTPKDDDILVTKKRATENRTLKAKRTLSEAVENDKTRVDMPTLTEDIIPPKDWYDDTPVEEEVTTTKNIFDMLGKGVLYLVFVLASSVILAYYVITCANDIFAFKKVARSVEIVVDAGDDAKDIAKKLAEKDVIDYPSIFTLYNSFKNRNSEKKQEFVADTYVFETGLNYDELIAKFEKSAPQRSIVTITFPEGLSVDEMIDVFVENGVGSREGFVEAVKSSLMYDMTYPFLVELQELERSGFEEGRKYALEGYLYPDTYEFYTDSSEIDAVAKLLRTFNVRFEKEYYERCNELGYSVDEIVNIAAIVQKETKYSSEYPVVSSLYHNRLNAPARFPRLQCDSTYLYAFPDRREGLTLDEMKASDSPYSTYSHDGLPPSAICNPSLDAIIAALYPDATSSDGKKNTYYYMVARPSGYHLFASTESEHVSNIAMAEAERRGS